MSYDIYLRIYMDDPNTLVLEGQDYDDIEDAYYPQRWDDKCQRIGTVVIGGDHISITHDAKAAIKRIYKECHHNGSDISSISVTKISRGACFSYIGPRITKINVEEAIRNKEEFFIGHGDEDHDISLLDDFVLIDNPKTRKIADLVIDFWVNEFCTGRDDVSEDQIKIFRDELRKYIGMPEKNSFQFYGGSVGYEHNPLVNDRHITDALKKASIPYTVGETISVYICNNKPYNSKRWYANVYRSGGNAVTIAEAYED